MSVTEPTATPQASPRWQLAGVLLNRDARWMTPHLWRCGCLVAVWLAFASATEGVTRSAAAGLVILENLTFASALGLLAWTAFGVGSVLRDEWVGNNLELVQLTGISSFDLLLAKMIPTWMTAASVLLLEIPCLQLCVTLGGVTPVQVWAVVWQLFLMFLVTSAITALLATNLRSPKAIAVLTGLFFLAYCMVAFVLVDLPSIALAEAQNRQSGVNNMTSAASFFMQFGCIYRSGFAGPVLNWQSLVHLLFVVGMLRATGAALREKLSASRDTEPIEDSAPEGEVHQTNLPVWRPSYKPPPITGNAIEWKDYHFTLGGNDMWYGKLVCFVGLIVFGLLSVVARFADTGSGEWVGLLSLSMFLTVVASLLTMAYSARRLWQQELRERTMGALITLPLTAREIVYSKMRAFVRMSTPEIAATVFFLLLVISHSLTTQEWGASSAYAAFLLCVPLVACTDAAWKLLPNSVEGFVGGLQLAGMNLLIWTVSGTVAAIVAPEVGLVLLAVLVPFSCGIALSIAASRLEKHAGELEM